MGARVIRIDPDDNVAVAVEAIAQGQPIDMPDGSKLTAQSDIPIHHKVALREIAAGTPVIKYGESIGLASQRIEPGQWVHIHNIKPEEA